MSDWPYDLIFEVDFDTAPDETPTAWVDLSDRVRPGASIVQGTPSGGSCRLQLNNRDRALDPTNLSAPYNLDIMRHARLRVTFDGTTSPLWRGFVEDWPPVWPEFGQAIVDVKLVDGWAWFALQESDVDFPRQTVGDRIAAVADLAGWPASLRNIDAGVVWLDPFERQSTNLAAVLSDCAAAEDGDLWFGPDGVLEFHSRHARLDNTVTFTAGDGGLPVASVSPQFGGGRVVNVASVQLADGSVYESSDEDSTAARGPRQRPVRDLPLPKVEAVAWAEWDVVRWAEPKVWLDRLVVRGAPGSGLSDLLAARLGDVIRFVTNPPGGGTVTIDGHVESIAHRVGAGEWLTTFDLSPDQRGGPWGAWLSDEASGDAWWLSDVETSGPLWAP